MTSPPDRREAPAERPPGDAGRIVAARSALAAIDTAVLSGRRKETRAEHRRRTAAFVTALFSDD